jgi:large subunit ribosomal protein L10
MTNTPQWKVEAVNQTADEISKSPVTAIVSIKGLRNKQFQEIRRALRGKAIIKVMRGTLLEKAIDKVQLPEIKKLNQYVNGQIALVTTSMSPSALYSSFEKSRQKAAARGGEIADEDIVVPAKETNFPPGPMISEFQKVGLQAAIEKGKIVIKKEMVMVKKGEKISKEKAKVLEKLEILPLNIGLDIITAYEEGIIFSKEAMSITPESLSIEIASAFSRAKALATGAVFLVKEVVPELIVKARREAESLAMAGNYVDEANIEIFLMKAASQAAAIQEIGEDKPKAEETKEEEKKEEDTGAGFGALFG